MKSLPPVARNINVYCSKCETDRYFKVITHTSATTAKLKCEVCGCSRKYSLDEEDMAKATTKKKTPRGEKAAKATMSTMWNTMQEEYKGPQATKYAMNATFKNKESLVHPTFGVGFVMKAHAHKIEVLFSEGIKELLHSRV